MTVTKALRVRFKGEEFLFLGVVLDLNTSGPIATQEQFISGRPSFAHLCEDGNIRRYNSIIGTRADLEVIAETTIVQSTEELTNAMLEILAGDSWPWQRPRRH